MSDIRLKKVEMTPDLESGAGYRFTFADDTTIEFKNVQLEMNRTLRFACDEIAAGFFHMTRFTKREVENIVAIAKQKDKERK